MAKNLSEEAYGRKIKYDVEFNKTRTTLVNIRLNHNTDKDLLEYLATLPNKQGYIKDLIRKDMKKNQEGN